jgi:4-phosphopantoate--beta-alanine ligase
MAGKPRWRILGTKGAITDDWKGSFKAFVNVDGYPAEMEVKYQDGTWQNWYPNLAAHLLEARRPVITVNGNAAGLCADGLLSLARAVPAKVEVNLFHRSPERVEKVVRYLEDRGGKDILGRQQASRLEGIASDRAMCATEGIFSADVVLIPLEDGDRAGALVKAGKIVLAIDLNPLSRTAVEAHVTAVDELSRAVPNIERAVMELKDLPAERRRLISEYDNGENLRRSRQAMCDLLGAQQI